MDGLFADCDRDTLLVQVHQDGVACHTGARSCFFTRLRRRGAPAAGAAGPAMLEVLERMLESRKVAPPPGSYVARLLRQGDSPICRKIGEEAAEVITAALGGEGDERVVAEVADLWFHTMVLLPSRGIPLRHVFAGARAAPRAPDKPEARPERAVARGRLAAALLAAAARLRGGPRIEHGVFHSPKGYRVTLPAAGWTVAAGQRADLAAAADATAGRHARGRDLRRTRVARRPSTCSRGI